GGYETLWFRACRWPGDVARARTADPARHSMRSDRLMHTPPQLLLDLLELRPHAVPPGSPLEEESTLTGFPADEREAQEVEGLRFAKPVPGASGRSGAAKLDQ